VNHLLHPEADKEFAGAIPLKVISLKNYFALIGLGFLGVVSTQAQMQPMSGPVVMPWVQKQANLVIPYGVTVIGSIAYEGHGQLTHVKLPDSLKSIEFGAFSHCYNLTDIIIPASVTNIGEVAFTGCVRMTKIIVDPSNSVYSSVDGVLFNKDRTELITCPGGKTGNYVIPDGVIELDDNAFHEAEHLAGVTIPNSVTTIESHSFYGCTALTNISIGKNVSTIVDDGDEWITFSECPNLASINVDLRNPTYSSVDGVLYKNNNTVLVKYPEAKVGNFKVPNSVTEIENHSFPRSLHLTSISMGDNIKIIETHTFENCFGLTNVLFDKKLKDIGDAAFASCTNLTSVKIPDDVTDIGDSAFYGCANVTTVTIGKKVISIGDGCFSDCRNLKAIIVNKDNSTYGAADGVLFNKRDSAIVKCPEGKTGSYTIPDGIVKIMGFEFSTLTNIIVPKSVKTIEGQAFLNSRVVAIYFEGNAPKITGLPRHADELAFADCGNLIIYYRPGTKGWKAEFAGLPTAVWKK